MARYKIRLLYDVPGWAYHNRCLALAKYAPPDFDVSYGMCTPNVFPQGVSYDLIMQLAAGWLSKTKEYYRDAGTVIVGGLNVGWTPEHKQRLEASLRHADHIVINSRLCWEAAGHPDRTTWISNGVDRDVYRVNEPIKSRPPKVLWTGSEFHRRHTKLKRHNEIIVPLGERLEALGIPHDFRLANSINGPSKWSTTRMIPWYNAGTVYVCASTAEGTPNPALEAASCGTVVCSTAVGNMPELIEQGVNGMLTEGSLEAVLAGVVHCVEHYQAMAPAMQDAIGEWDWRYRAWEYYELFRWLLAQHDVGATAEAPGTEADNNGREGERDDNANSLPAGL